MYAERKSVKGARIGAAIIDMIIVGVASSIINLIITTLMYATVKNFDDYRSQMILTSVITAGIGALIQFGYYTFIPFLTKGKTISKMLVGIKVVSMTYEAPSFFQLLIRNIFLFTSIVTNTFTIITMLLISDFYGGIISIISLGLISGVGNIIYIVILIMIIASPEERGFHDMIAKTYVVSNDFDINRLTQINILERQNMDWADFDDDVKPSSGGNQPDQNDTNDDDTIEILKQDK